MRKGLFISCVGTLGLLASLLPVLSGSASAGIQVLERAFAPIQQYNSDCGANTDGTDIGNVSYQRYGTYTTMTVTITDGSPNTVYYEELWNAEPCVELNYLGALTTNSEGRASAVYRLDVPANDPWLFETGFADDDYNDTTTVFLPASR